MKDDDDDALFEAPRGAKGKGWSVGTILPVALLLVGLGWAGVYGARRYLRDLPDLGASCHEDRDCRSRRCLEIWDTADVVPARTAGVCTIECGTDDDCPASMTCDAVEKHAGPRTGPPGPLVGPHQPNARACLPRK
jgi:hypothetical protein